MASLNKCMFIGNVTKDIDLRYLPNGDAVANLSIACNESYKDKSGVKQETVEFVNVVAFRKLAEIIGEYVKKGSPIYIEGKMRTRSWEKDGVTRYTTEIIADSMQMLGGKADGEHGSSQRQDTPSNDQDNAPSAPSNFDDFDDDIPY